MLRLKNMWEGTKINQEVKNGIEIKYINFASFLFLKNNVK